MCNVNSSARFFLPAIVLAGLAATPLAAQPSNVKIGFVDSDAIFKQYPEAQEVQKKLDAMIQGWQDEIDQMSQEYQTMLQDYQQKQALMTEQARQQTEQDLLSLRQKILDFQNEKLGQNGELAQQQDKMLGPVKDKIIDAIGEIAKEEGFHFILDKNDQFLIVLYGDERFDVTFRVLDKLKRGSAGSMR